VAARLALGDPVTEVAQPADDKQAARGWPDDLAEIVYIDHYGNAMTGLRGALLGPEARLVVADRALERAATFSAVPPGEAFWYINSNGLAEVAVNGARADATLGLEIGSRIRIEN
jgi:S-adenosylmethionine hydrolase